MARIAGGAAVGFGAFDCVLWYRIVAISSYDPFSLIYASLLIGVVIAMIVMYRLNAPGARWAEVGTEGLVLGYSDRMVTRLPWNSPKLRFHLYHSTGRVIGGDPNGEMYAVIADRTSPITREAFEAVLDTARRRGLTVDSIIVRGDPTGTVYLVHPRGTPGFPSWRERARIGP